MFDLKSCHDLVTTVEGVQSGEFKLRDEIKAMTTEGAAEFMGAVAAAAKSGKKDFKFGGKTYPVTMSKKVSDEINSSTKKEPTEDEEEIEEEVEKLEEKISVVKLKSLSKRAEKLYSDCKNSGIWKLEQAATGLAMAILDELKALDEGVDDPEGYDTKAFVDFHKRNTKRSGKNPDGTDIEDDELDDEEIPVEVTEAKKMTAAAVAKLFKNTDDWGDDMKNQVRAVSGNLEVVDTWFYGEKKAQDALIKSWTSSNGTNAKYFKDEYDITFKLVDKFSLIKATGRYKKLTSDGIVGVILKIV